MPLIWGCRTRLQGPRASLFQSCLATTTSAGESLELARSRARIAEAPAWFGAIHPFRLSRGAGGPGARAGDTDVRLRFRQTDVPESPEDEDGEPVEESRILKLFSSPLASDTVSDFLHKLLGSSRSAGDGAADLTQMRVVFNHDGQHAASPRGALVWGLSESDVTAAGAEVRGPAAGGGYWGIDISQFGGENYITGISASLTQTASRRSVTVSER